MFITVRRFRLKDADIQDVIRRVRAEIVPTFQKIPGFKSYKIVDFRDGTFGSISVYETEQASNQANRVALEAAGVSMSDVLEFTSIQVWRTLYEAAPAS